MKKTLISDFLLVIALFGIMAISLTILSGCSKSNNTDNTNKATVTDANITTTETIDTNKTKEYEDKISELETKNNDLNDKVAKLEKEIDTIKNSTETSTEATTENTTTSTESTTESSATTEDHTYDGLAVSNCHDVTLKKGTSYNDALDAVIEGTTAYPNTFPNINSADLNEVGTYICYWETNSIPLNYAMFTITIVD